MATRLKDTDVVIIGLGAAGGVAALPLAQAGLEVIGLEAGTWLTQRDFAPDELRNNFRGWPQARAEGEPGDPDVARQRVVADRAARRRFTRCRTPSAARRCTTGRRAGG